MNIHEAREILRSIAAEVREETGDNGEAFVEQFRELISGSKYREAVICWAAEEWWDRYVRPSIRQEIIANQPGPNRALASLYGSAQAARDRWLLYPLRDGSPLGDATLDKLEVEISFHDKLSRTLAHKARWFQSIVDSVKAVGADCVSAALDGEAIEKLYEETK